MGDTYVDLFATKGLEYILVIAFLVTLVVFWRFLNRQTKAVSALRPVPKRSGVPLGWFLLREGIYYHQGHSWARPERDNIVRVGMDDFAQKLVGKTQSVKLPRIGDRMGQGETGWELLVGSKSIPMLSPVNGEVVGVNEEIVRSPHLINQDPYDKGWLLEIRASTVKTDLKNLLHGRLASAWLEETVNALRERSAGGLRAVLQDGGVPVDGIAKSLSPDRWVEVARELLLTQSD